MFLSNSVQSRAPLASGQRSCTETSAGSGALRMFSGAAGDSISVPVRVDEGC